MGHILLDNVDCIGNETSLLDCGHEGVSQHNCIHKEDTGIICQGGMSNLFPILIIQFQISSHS